MWVVQLSAGQGPEECSRAVGLALQRLQHEAQQQQVSCQILEQHPGRQPGCFKSVLLAMRGQQAQILAQRWQGPMQWLCTSPYRPRHKRKNWFFSGQVFELPESPPASSDGACLDNDIDYQSCRSSGAGGQHVNTTNSAVQAWHRPSGIRVRVESERSQHANKKLARALIQHKLQQQRQSESAQQEQQRWQQHQQLQRGGAMRCFHGPQFREA
ncbi:peptide chain release factor H [Bacterioplanes sanyensis]|uniref:Peptide chain release factor H n=1 Tax=Bacterioplanes sanyensis TaxID=1249553 RepID=A0A222FGD1_9GAMM|nr:peptide chain release factor H [Bacterioplanes sanyensis]ASP37692.1 peptide chain release factor H [Bacterioplanes sanyensis]